MAVEVPAARGGEVRADLRPSWLCAVSWCAIYLELALGYLLSVAAARTHQERLVRIFGIAGFAIHAAVRAAQALACRAAGDAREAAAFALDVPRDLALVVGLWLFEARLPETALAYAAVFAATAAAVARGIYDAPWPSLALTILPSPAAAAAAFAITVKLLRRRALRRAARLVRADRERYDALWAAVAGSPDSESALRDIQAQAQALAARTRPSDARQYAPPDGAGTGYPLGPAPSPPARANGAGALWRAGLAWATLRRGSGGRVASAEAGVRGAGAGAAGGSGAEAVGGADLRRPLDCLDQLFAQAAFHRTPPPPSLAPLLIPTSSSLLKAHPRGRSRRRK